MSCIVTARYTDNLYSDLTHLQNGNVIGTDTPTDNNDIGGVFSPTDLFAAPLGACAMTIMGMKMMDLGMDLVDACTGVVKKVATSPCRVVRMVVGFYLGKDLDERSRRLLEAAARTCPVAQSLNAELVQGLRFHYE